MDVNRITNTLIFGGALLSMSMVIVALWTMSITGDVPSPTGWLARIALTGISIMAVGLVIELIRDADHG